MMLGLLVLAIAIIIEIFQIVTHIPKGMKTQRNCSHSLSAMFK